MGTRRAVLLCHLARNQKRAGTEAQPLRVPYIYVFPTDLAIRCGRGLGR
jgi:hypothetical protein